MSPLESELVTDTRESNGVNLNLFESIGVHWSQRLRKRSFHQPECKQFQSIGVLWSWSSRGEEMEFIGVGGVRGVGAIFLLHITPIKGVQILLSLYLGPRSS